MYESLHEHINTIKRQLDHKLKLLGIEQKSARIAELEDKSQQSNFWNAEGANDMMRELASLKRRVEPWKNLEKRCGDAAELLDMASADGDASMEAELADSIESIEKEFARLEDELLFSGDDDDKNCFLNIHPGAGGTESCDWASMLYRMYIRWIERKGYKAEMVDYLDGAEAGIKNVTVLVKGEDAYGHLKAECGIHRLVRISPFDANARRHTSFVAVEVVPEISDDVAVDINENDLRIDTYRSSGKGGQHVNKTDSAVRITHLPTGVVVACQNERSQIQNRAMAMKVLRARLYALEQEKRENELAQKVGEKKKIEWGSQIRSYVFQPYQLVKDLRTGHETGNIQAMMDGELLDDFIITYLKYSQTGE